jgi:hypothetical protein
MHVLEFQRFVVLLSVVRHHPTARYTSLTASADNIILFMQYNLYTLNEPPRVLLTDFYDGHFFSPASQKMTALT